jgi:hypothetical protein
VTRRVTADLFQNYAKFPICPAAELRLLPDLKL